MPLSSDGDRTVNRTGHDRDSDGSPAGLLGCLPRRLCLLWVMEGMTQLQTKINRPYSDVHSPSHEPQNSKFVAPPPPLHFCFQDPI